MLALLAFAISAVSIPLLLDRPDANVIDAMATSFRTVQTNFLPMLFWAALIVVFTAAGIATLYLGLIVTLPLIGHATWHAYRDLVSFPDRALNGAPTTRDGLDPMAPLIFGVLMARAQLPWAVHGQPRARSMVCIVGFLLFGFGARVHLLADRQAYRPPH